MGENLKTIISEKPDVDENVSYDATRLVGAARRNTEASNQAALEADQRIEAENEARLAIESRMRAAGQQVLEILPGQALPLSDEAIALNEKAINLYDKADSSADKAEIHYLRNQDAYKDMAIAEAVEAGHDLSLLDGNSGVRTVYEGEKS